MIICQNVTFPCVLVRGIRRPGASKSAKDQLSSLIMFTSPPFCHGKHADFPTEFLVTIHDPKK